MRKKKNSTGVRRPSVVTAIALTQFAKAGVILAATWLMWQRPGPEFRAGLLWQVSDILTTGRSGLDFLGPVFAGYALAVGCGLWLLEKWARGTLMATSGLTALGWLAAVFINSQDRYGWGQRLSLPSCNPQTLYTVILVEAAIFLYLAFGRDVPEAFHHLDPPHL